MNTICLDETQIFLVNYALDCLIDKLQTKSDAREPIDEMLVRHELYEIPDCHIKYVEKTRNKFNQIMTGKC